MKKPNGPCLGCKRRTAEDPEKGTEDCHKTCKDYADYKIALEEFKRYQQEAFHKAELGQRPWMKRFRGVIKSHHD